MNTHTPERNFGNRTLWIADNLKVMREMNSGSVDLIYLDPPFNTQQIFNAPLGSKAAGAMFNDTWRMSNFKEQWIELQEELDPAIYHTIMGASMSSGEHMQAYLCFMAPRLVECHRLLNDTGSIYLHCDPTASHYLKQLLDVIFGSSNYRNEIVWCYTGNSNPKKVYPSKHDTIFWYSKSSKASLNKQYVPYSKATLRRYNHVDKDGRRYKMSTLNKKTGLEKVYMNTQGRRALDWWPDIPIAMGKERTGWPTQKPLALLERIIQASSNPGDLVFDPFCGCATSMVAAEKLGRMWAGVDIDKKAGDVMRDRLGTLDIAAGTVNITSKPPERSDHDKPTRSPKIKQILWSKLGDGERRHCLGCDRQKYYDDFEVDHITPKSRGGADIDSNLQLLCGACNRKKGNRLTLNELRKSNNLTV